MKKNNIIKFLTVKQLLSKKVHLGHKTHDWNPRISQIIFCKRSDIYIIDLEQTIFLLQRALAFLTNVKKFNYKLLFAEKNIHLSTLKQAFNNINLFDHFWVTKRFSGDLISILKQKQTNFKDIIIPLNNKLLPNILVLSDTIYFKSILFECYKHKIISVGLIDTNNSNYYITYPIPCNNDNRLSINFIYNLIFKALNISKYNFYSRLLFHYRKQLLLNYTSIFN